MMLWEEAEYTGPARALRLTIVQIGEDLTVVSSQSLRTRVPSSDPTYGFENQSGFWFEVRSKQKECLYRRVVPNPFTDEIETLSGDPDRPFRRVKVPSEKHVAVFLVPELEAGHDLALWASPKEKPNAKARVFATIDLRNPTGKVTMSPPEEPAGDPTKKKRTKKRKGRQQ
jgi:hypothetical protein